VVDLVTTQLFFRGGSLDWSRGEGDADILGTVRNWTVRALGSARGTTAISDFRTSIVGSTTGLEAWQGGTSPTEFISEPLDRDVTISGTVTVNLWGLESSMNANAALGVIIERLDSKGARVSTIAQGIATAELGTAAAVNNFTLTPTSTNMLRGDRFRVRAYFDDAPATTMASGFTLTFRFDGLAAADGDSYIQFTEDFGFMAGPSTLVSQVSGTGNNIVFGTTSTITAVAQSFQLTAGASIGSVTVRLSNFGASNPTGDFLAEIRTDNAGVPSSTVLGSGTMPNASYTAPGFNTITLTSPSGVLTASTTYWLVLSEVGGGANLATWSRAASNIYASGAPKRFESGAWVDNPTNPTFDHVFTLISQDYTTPLGSTLYLTDSASAVDPNGSTHDAKDAWTSRGGGVVSASSNPVAGPAAPVLARVNASGNFLEWFTRGLSAFTLSGLIQCNIRALEVNAGNNCAVGCEIAICATDGTSPVIWGESLDGVELGTSEAAMTFLVAGDDVAVTAGQRLRIRVYWDDAPSVAMSLVNSNTLFYAGTTASASGDTYIVLPQTVTEFSSGTPISASDSATASDTVADRVIAVSDSGNGADTSALTAPYAVTDTATGADVSAVSVPISATDSATAADTSDKGMTALDTGSGADTVSTLVRDVTDAAVGADASGKGMTAADTAAGADTSAVSVPVPVNDSATGADVSALTAAIPVTDTGSGADSVPTLAKAVVDAATAADTSSVSTAANPSATDSGTASDTATLTAALPTTDTGTAADTAGVTTAGANTADITTTLPSLTQVMAAVSITPLVPVFDSFNRADAAIGTSTSGHTWIAQSGTWDISTNRAYRSSSAMQSTVVIDSGFTTCSLSVDATLPAGLNDAGVVFAGTDDNNYLLLVFESGGPALHELRLWKRDAGAFTLLSGPHAVPNYASTTKRVRVEWAAATGEIGIWFDYVQITTLTLGSADQAKYATGTRQGLRENAVPAGDKTYFDNYSLTPLSMPALSTLVRVRSANTTGWSDPASDTTMAGAGTQVIVVTAGI
jgi:hypothetical protein